MTTLIGIKGKSGGVIVAADKLLTSHAQRLATTCKLITFAPNNKPEEATTIGVAGPSTLLHALGDILEDFEAEYLWDTERHIYSNLLLIHTILRDQHGMKTDPDDNGGAFESSNFELIVGNRHGLFAVLAEREVMQCPTFTSLGTGRDIALGAIAALGIDNPAATIKRTYEIVTSYDLATGRDYDVWEAPK